MSNENDVDIDWFDIANLLYGDVLPDEEAVMDMAVRLETIREDIVCDTIPVINSLDDAKKVHGQLLYKINQLQQEKNRHLSQINQTEHRPRTHRLNSTQRLDQSIHSPRRPNVNILTAVEQRITEYKTLKAEVDALNNQLNDSARVDAVNAQLQEIFEEDLVDD